MDNDKCDVFLRHSELSCIDMLINVKKSSCLGIGQAYNHECGRDMNWSDNIRYLGVYRLYKVS